MAAIRVVVFRDAATAVAVLASRVPPALALGLYPAQVIAGPPADGDDADGAVVVVALPSAGRVHHALVFHWARIARHEMTRQYDVRCRMALAQTLGGGWASIRRAPEARAWARQLKRLARRIGDEATVRKCRVFVGWARLWRGDVAASGSIFEQQLRVAASAGDETNHNRCVAALLHHANAAGAGASSPAAAVVNDLCARWVAAFSSAAAPANT